jgi:hypothetical protein
VTSRWCSEQRLQAWSRVRPCDTGGRLDAVIKWDTTTWILDYLKQHESEREASKQASKREAKRETERKVFATRP